MDVKSFQGGALLIGADQILKVNEDTLGIMLVHDLATER